MKISVKSPGFHSGPSLNMHILRRLRSILGHWTSRVEAVVVRLADLNGPRGGQDKSCSILVEAPGCMPVVVSATSTDYYSAVDLAARRAGRAAARLFERRSH